MGYANARWEMPPSSLEDYEPGDLHGMGSYGIMRLRRNLSVDTLGEASKLTEVLKEKLKTDRESPTAWAGRPFWRSSRAPRN